jgi:hypothetical protein
LAKYSIIFFLGIFLGITLSDVYSQENQSSINILNWDSLYTEPIAVDSNFLKSDAVILYKTMDIKIPEATFSGVQKSEPYIFITVFQRVKILNDSGVYDFTRVTLPENYDPFFDPKIKLIFGINFVRMSVSITYIYLFNSTTRKFFYGKIQS